MTDTPDIGQEDDDLTAFLVAEKHNVYLRKPTDGQLAVLMLMAGVDSSDGFRMIIGQLGAVEEVMDSLCVPPSEIEDDDDAVDIRALKRMMARGEIELEDYFGPAVGLLERWGDDQEVASNREARRAAAKAPRKVAAKAATRPGRQR